MWRWPNKIKCVPHNLGNIQTSIREIWLKFHFSIKSKKDVYGWSRKKIWKNPPKLRKQNFFKNSIHTYQVWTIKYVVREFYYYTIYFEEILRNFDFDDFFSIFFCNKKIDLCYYFRLKPAVKLFFWNFLYIFEKTNFFWTTQKPNFLT